MAGPTTARALRRRMTDAERRLWHALRDRRLGGRKFRRQHPIDGYVADFCCLQACLIIEVDGGQHEPDRDRRRMSALEKAGFRLLRFWNNEVLTNLDGVLRTILLACQAPHPHPLPAGEGEGNPPPFAGEGGEPRRAG